MEPIGIIMIIATYFAGGIPIGLLVGRARGVDIREYGSGNIGASNVLRTLGGKAGAAVWVADALKGFAPVMVARCVPLSPEAWVAGVGLAAVLGHCFSPYLRLSGGRGVSTTLGVFLALDWRVGLSAFALWIVTVAITRYISVGSMLAAASAVLFFAVYDSPGVYLGMGVGIAVLVASRHSANIRRLITGTEAKIGKKGGARSKGSG